MTTKEKHYKYPLVGEPGHPAHFRKIQNLIWAGILGVLVGAGVAAGVYWWFLQQKYFGHYSLKGWWDSGMGIFRSPSWVYYRHGERNQLEPAFGTLFILGFLVGVKDNSKAKLHSGWFLAGTGVILLAVAVSGAALITWITYFEAPARFNHHHPLSTLWTTLLTLVLGIILGKILHYGWKPAAATIQYHLLEGPLRKGKVPLWAKLGLAPVTLRERFYDLYRKLKDPENPLTHARLEAQQEERGAKNHSKWFSFAVTLGILLILFLAITGDIAKLWIAHGHSFPGMVS